MTATRTSESNTLILKIPILEYPGDNRLVEPNITGYDQQLILEGEEFILDPATLGSLLAQSVGAMKLKIVEIQPDSVAVAILADSRNDKIFYPRNPIENQVIKNGSCIPAYPLVMDVRYQYCFVLGTSDSHATLEYNLVEEGIMPTP